MRPFAGAGRVLFLLSILLAGCGSDDPADPDYEWLAANLEVLGEAMDATGRKLDVIELPPMPSDELDGDVVPTVYANVYLANGGVIVPAVNPCRDGFTAMALVLEALAVENTTVRGLRGRLPRYAMVKEKLPCRRRFIAPCLRLVRYHNSGQEMDLTDGVKVLRSDGRWLHVRGSNTEPVIRITAEAASRDAARELVEEVLEYLRPACG